MKEDPNISRALGKGVKAERMKAGEWCSADRRVYFLLCQLVALIKFLLRRLNTLVYGDLRSKERGVRERGREEYGVGTGGGRRGVEESGMGEKEGGWGNGG